MKYIVFMIFLLTLFQGCFSTQVKFAENKQHDLEPADVITFCEIFDNAKAFDNKEVRVSAILLIGKESGFLYDPKCISKKKLIWFESKDDKENKKLDSYLNPDSSEYRSKGVVRVKAELLGTFHTRNDQGFGHLNEFNYLFTVKEVKNLEYVPENIPYPQ